MRRLPVLLATLLTGCAPLAFETMYPDDFEAYDACRSHKAIAVARDLDGAHGLGYACNRGTPALAAADALARCRARRAEYSVADRCTLYRVDTLRVNDRVDPNALPTWTLEQRFPDVLAGYAARPHPKALAFAFDPDGAYAWGSFYDAPTDSAAAAGAVRTCERNRHERLMATPCRLYRIGDAPAKP